MKLGDVLSSPLRNGFSPSTDGHIIINVLTLSAITGSKFDPEQTKVGKFISEILGIQRVSTQDFLICRGNGNKELVGRGYFPTIDMPDTVFPDTVIAGRIDRDKIRPSFLENLWNHPIARKKITG